MPQPLSSVAHRTLFIGNGYDSPSRTRPALALHAMNVVGEWSLLESFVNGLFVELLGARATTAAAIFSSIRSQAGQRDAFRAVASVSLENDRDYQDILVAILEVCDRASRVRNRVCHWVWGHSQELQDAVLLGDPTAMIAHTAAIQDWSHEVGKAHPRAPMPEIDKRRVFVYREADFVEASQKIHRAIHLVTSFGSALSDRRYQQWRGTPYDRPSSLLAEPEIRQILTRLNKDRQSDPEAP